MKLYIKIVLGVVVVFLLYFIWEKFLHVKDNDNQENNNQENDNQENNNQENDNQDNDNQDNDIHVLAKHLNTNEKFTQDSNSDKIIKILRNEYLLDEKLFKSLELMINDKNFNTEALLSILNETNSDKVQQTFSKLYMDFRKKLSDNNECTDNIGNYSKKLKLLTLLFLVISNKKYDEFPKSGWARWEYIDKGVNSGYVYNRTSGVCSTTTDYEGSYDGEIGSDNFFNIMKECVTHDLHDILKYMDEWLWPDELPSNCSLVRVDES